MVLKSIDMSILYFLLQDAFSREELDAFDRRIKAEFPQADYLAELKIDGLSISQPMSMAAYELGLPEETDSW